MRFESGRRLWEFSIRFWVIGTRKKLTPSPQHQIPNTTLNLPAYFISCETIHCSSLETTAILFLIHHIVIAVNNLKLAVEEFENLGFRVSPGGKHDGGFSHNALIHFEDGSFLELFAFRNNLKTHLIRWADKLNLLESRKSKPHLGYMPRFMKGLHGKEGMIDFAVQVEDIDTFKSNIELKSIGPTLSFSRKRPDGITLAWQLSFPKQLSLPFLMSPYEPPQTVSPENYQHPNGVKGIRQLDVYVQEWDNHFQEFMQFLDTTPQIGREAKEPKASFQVGTQNILLKSSPDSGMEGLGKIYFWASSSPKKVIKCRNVEMEIEG